jgi:aminoglycoside N3'-acetyltransferase
MKMTRVDKANLIKGLRELGITGGMGLMVHASLSSFGYLEGGARTVIEALMEIITPEGTLMMPSFNHGKPFEKNGPGYFHPEQTSTINGAIPDLFWRMQNVHRSLNPTHPFAAWGKHSQRYTASHHRTLTMGPQSPLGQLHADDGTCLLLGVGYRANTFHHVVEVSTGAPCIGLRTEAYPVILPNGHNVMGRTWSWRAGVCPHTDRIRYAPVMHARGLQRVTRIGECYAILYRLQDGFQVIAEILKQGKDGFPPCERCAIRPRQTLYTVPSDWDPTHQRPLPDSEAWTY